MSIQLEVRSYRGGDRHHHEFSQILLPMQGAMRLDVEGRRGVVSHNCVALIPQYCEHGFEPSSDCSMLILDVDMAGLGSEAQPALLNSREPSLLPIAPWLWRMFRQLGTEVETGACPTGAAARMAMTALHLVEPGERPQPWSRAERRVLDVAEAGQGAGVAQMARMAGLGQSQFHALFRATMGRSPKQLQLQRLFERAAERLATTSAPVSEIAYDLGYQNAASFNRQFKRRFGLTPSEFRAANRRSGRS
ncbi:AraC family transcriptional regulator [uncultured Bosea sp.]|uniref:helix-turn-helix domain-containing protein n=1 Tax=uncultured Bosea sp. TaxID=211457 RepID=UPI00263B5D32|nr:AraC family transcriptional regulator [uncultured Bosea sp.]